MFLQVIEVNLQFSESAFDGAQLVLALTHLNLQFCLLSRTLVKVYFQLIELGGHQTQFLVLLLEFLQLGVQGNVGLFTLGELEVDFFELLLVELFILALDVLVVLLAARELNSQIIELHLQFLVGSLYLNDLLVQLNSVLLGNLVQSRGVRLALPDIALQIDFDLGQLFELNLLLAEEVNLFLSDLLLGQDLYLLVALLQLTVDIPQVTTPFFDLNLELAQLAFQFLVVFLLTSEELEILRTRLKISLQGLNSNPQLIYL